MGRREFGASSIGVTLGLQNDHNSRYGMNLVPSLVAGVLGRVVTLLERIRQAYYVGARSARQRAERVRVCRLVFAEGIHAILAWSAVDDGHVRFAVTFAGGRREFVQPLHLLRAQLEAVCGYVLLDAGYPLRARNRGDVVALREQPR